MPSIGTVVLECGIRSLIGEIIASCTVYAFWSCKNLVRVNVGSFSSIIRIFCQSLDMKSSENFVAKPSI